MSNHRPVRALIWSLTALLTLPALAQPTPPAAPGPETAPAAPAPAERKPPEPAPQQIDVIGTRDSDTAQRRQSTAAKIVIGREEIDKYGDSTLGEVLRRLPGVTTSGAPGRGGPPRMRGLGGGYTQLLIDGQRVPPGFSLESLTPEQVERIEILRAPTAETGARAIAGTINIITREGFSRRINDLRLGLGLEDGELSPGLGWTRNDSTGPLTANLSTSVFSNRRLTRSSSTTTRVDTASGAITGEEAEDTRGTEHRQGINLAARLQWRLSDAGDVLSLVPTLFHTRSHGQRSSVLLQAVPAAPALPPYDTSSAATDGRTTTARIGSQWRQRLGAGPDGPRLEANGAVGGWQSRNDTARSEFRNAVATPLRTLQDSAATRERSASASAKLSQLWGGSADQPDSAHSVVGGAELEAVRRRETRLNTQLDGEGEGDNLQADSLRAAAYLQDEWALSPQWAAHAGLRWEGITTRGEADSGARPTNRSSVTTPLLHAVWKPRAADGTPGRDQIRFSLTRSYRAPALATLIAQPVISNKVPPNGPNDPTTSPDRAGNPDLKPELATGIDIAAERYLAGGGVLSVNLFHRNISNLMRSVTVLETVAYSAVPRWVARQQNIGDAVTQGVELEARFALDQLLAAAPRVELRSNLSVFRSRVAGVPGPDNRLDQQARATGNVGADYRFRTGALRPLMLGGNLNWVPGTETQLSDSQRTRSGSKRVFDSFALWTFTPAVGLRLLASNVAPREFDSSNAIATADDVETTTTTTPSATHWQLRLELKL